MHGYSDKCSAKTHLFNPVTFFELEKAARADRFKPPVLLFIFYNGSWNQACLRGPNDLVQQNSVTFEDVCSICSILGSNGRMPSSVANTSPLPILSGEVVYEARI